MRQLVLKVEIAICHEYEDPHENYSVGCGDKHIFLSCGDMNTAKV